MDIPFHGGNDYHWHVLPSRFPEQQGFQDLNGIFHGFSTGNQLGQEVFSLVKKFPHFPDCRKKYLVQKS